MKHSKFLLSSLFLLFIAACSSQKYTPANYPDAQIRFGSGGGVAGIETAYCLLDNGRMFMSEDANEDFQKYKKVSKKTYEALFERAEELGLGKMKFQQPGNLYRFIETGNTMKRNRVSWGTGNNQKTPPEGITALYNELSELVK